MVDAVESTSSSSSELLLKEPRQDKKVHPPPLVIDIILGMFLLAPLPPSMMCLPCQQKKGGWSLLLTVTIWWYLFLCIYSLISVSSLYRDGMPQLMPPRSLRWTRRKRIPRLKLFPRSWSTSPRRAILKLTRTAIFFVCCWLAELPLSQFTDSFRCSTCLCAVSFVLFCLFVV